MASLRPNSPRSTSSDSQKGVFPLTQWSAISVARGEDSERATEGLQALAVNYWRPLYLFLRKRGESHEDASDLVQGFFAHVVGGRFLKHVDREGGKFRSYLLKSLENWLMQERRRERTQKRGGGAEHVAIDSIEALDEVVDGYGDVSPEVAFDRQWAMDMVSRVGVALRAEYLTRGRENWFDALEPALPGGGRLPPYADLMGPLNTTEAALKKAVFDLRAAFTERLKEEIRATVRTNQDAEEELRYLASVLTK